MGPPDSLATIGCSTKRHSAGRVGQVTDMNSMFADAGLRNWTAATSAAFKGARRSTSRCARERMFKGASAFDPGPRLVRGKRREPEES